MLVGPFAEFRLGKGKTNQKNPDIVATFLFQTVSGPRPTLLCSCTDRRILARKATKVSIPPAFRCTESHGFSCAVATQMAFRVRLRRKYAVCTLQSFKKFTHGYWLLFFFGCQGMDSHEPRRSSCTVFYLPLLVPSNMYANPSPAQSKILKPNGFDRTNCDICYSHKPNFTPGLVKNGVSLT